MTSSSGAKLDKVEVPKSAFKGLDVRSGMRDRSGLRLVVEGFLTQCLSLWRVFIHLFARKSTIQYPEQMPYMPPRYRGRIVLTRDPDGEERCVACNLCAVACPVSCISLQKGEKEDGRWYPEWFRINFSRCIYCGMCEEACPTYAIQLTPDYEMAEYDRRNMVYEKEHLLIAGQGKVPGYSFYKVAGLAIAGKPKGAAQNEEPPVDPRSLLP
jgi:NADH-quinone oxidoreductase subunit I